MCGRMASPICTPVIIRQARLFICTGTPIQPHDTAGLADLDVEYRWAAIPPRTVDHLGLGGVVDNIHTFKRHFGLGRSVGGGDAAEEEEEDGYEVDDFRFDAFVPDELGVEHVLPDNVKVAVRMRLDGGRYVAEWLLPNRRPLA